MERVLQPEAIVGTPEAESYFRDQSRRMFKHALRGELDIDVDDLDTLAPGSGLYVIEGDDEGDGAEVVVVEGSRGVPTPGSGLYVRSDAQQGSEQDQFTEKPLTSVSPLLSSEQIDPDADASAVTVEVPSKPHIGEGSGIAPEVGEDDSSPGRSSSFERLYDGVKLAAVPGASVVSAEDLGGRVGDKFQTRTLPPASSFEDVYRRALDDGDAGSEHSDESDGTYPSVIAAGSAVVTHAEGVADEVVRHAVSDTAAVSGQAAQLDLDSDDEFEFLERQMAGEEEAAPGGDAERLMPVFAGEKSPTECERQLEGNSQPGPDDAGDEFELLERQLLSEGISTDADDEFERLERQLAAEETVSLVVVADDANSGAQVIDQGVEDVSDVRDLKDNHSHPGSTAHATPSSPVVECLPGEVREGSPGKQPSPEPLVSTPTRSRRGVPVARHETFHHVPRVTVTDADDVRDVTDDGEEGVVIEPADEDGDSIAGGRPTIVELVDDDDETGNLPVSHHLM